MPPLCSSCRKDGFQWNRDYCFYCGASRTDALPEAVGVLRKKVLVPLIKEPVSVDLNSIPLSGWNCPSCNREGFKWNRNYCSYCGVTHPEIDPSVAAEGRRMNDALFDQTLEQIRESRAQRSRSWEPPEALTSGD